MIKLILEKELKEIIRSNKFVGAFAVCATLILLTFYVGARNYQTNLERYEAAKTENLRKMEGMTDWAQVQSNRIFLPPNPLEALVSGVANDIGRTVEVFGQGELSANDSRYGDDPIFAVFRFLDLTFIFESVLSLFAILFAYDAISGEKERGALRLTFATAVPKAKYILGKLVGNLLALGLPLLIPVLLGCLLLPLLGVHLAGNDRIRLLLVIGTGLLYFGAFLTLSILISTLTTRSAHAFLFLLIAWIFSVLIVPRTAVLLAGRAVYVPSVDEIAAQKSRLRSQLGKEELAKMASFQPREKEDIEKMLQEFQAFNQKLSSDRNQKMSELSQRLGEDRRNRQEVQQKLAFGLARVSPAAAFSLAVTRLAGNSLSLKEHFLEEAHAYQKNYSAFMIEKTGMAMDGRQMMIRIDDQEREPIDPHELPDFNYNAIPLADSIQAAIPDMALLVLFNLVFFAAAFVCFLSYDVR